jgi:archaellum component FlaC
MARARVYELMALKQTIELNAYRREAARLHEEIDRLEKRREQIVDLDQGYREQLATPGITANEYRDITQIIARLHERTSVDLARREILETERERVGKILAERKRKIERLEEEAKMVKVQERQALDERALLLMPERRK